MDSTNTTMTTLTFTNLGSTQNITAEADILELPNCKVEVITKEFEDSIAYYAGAHSWTPLIFSIPPGVLRIELMDQLRKQNTQSDYKFKIEFMNGERFYEISNCFVSCVDYGDEQDDIITITISNLIISEKNYE